MITYLNKYKKTILVLVLILFFCLSPIPKSATNLEFSGKLGLDKWFHFFMYYLLYLVWASENTRISERVFLFIVLSILFGVIIEILQGITLFGRSPELADFFADFSGILFGYFISNRKKSLY